MIEVKGVGEWRNKDFVVSCYLLIIKKGESKNDYLYHHIDTDSGISHI